MVTFDMLHMAFNDANSYDRIMHGWFHHLDYRYLFL
jgi:hypothetical protein